MLFLLSSLVKLTFLNIAEVVMSFVQLRAVEAPGDVDGQFTTIDNADHLGGSTRVD